jgi:hypothetical protein
MLNPLRFFSSLMNVAALIRSAACLLVARTVLAGPTPSEAAPDKSHYHLFNPTPRAEMRELNTDRPDQTESPYTVDAGHFQVELDFFKFTYDRHSSDGVRTKSWNLAPINLKAGLSNNVDLQIVLDNYIHERTTNPASRASGFGDITARLKINFWGNDGGATAFGIMPFVKLPLESSSLRNGRTEGGVILPLAVALPGGWGMGVMTEVDFVSDDDGGHDAEWVNSITLSHDLVGHLGGYVEFFSVVGNAPGFDWQGQVDVGLTYGLTENVQLDCGCNFGITESAPDLQPFAGFSWRF